MRRSTCSTLYKSCLRSIAQNLGRYQHDDYLQMLPKQIKCALIELVTKSYNGFVVPTSLQMLLNSEVDSLDLANSTLTDNVLEDLQRCTQLKRLVLPSLNGTDCAKETLCDLIPRLRHLEHLRIRDSDIVDDYVISLLQQHCPNLDLLDIEKCQNITDEAFAHITQMRLSKLNLSHTQITDNGMKRIENSQLEQRLEDLNVKYCKITCAGLNYLRWDKIKYIGFEVVDVESKIEPEPKKGTGMCWFRRDIILA